MSRSGPSLPSMRFSAGGGSHGGGPMGKSASAGGAHLAGVLARGMGLALPALVLLVLGFHMGWMSAGLMPPPQHPLDSLSMRLSSLEHTLRRHVADGDASVAGAGPGSETADTQKTGSTQEGMDGWNPSRCNRSEEFVQQGSVVWLPKNERYLLAMCSGGQLSNRLACVRQSMLDAALMNRTLLLPTTGIDYNYEHLLDLDAMEQCFGRGRVMSLHDYASKVLMGVKPIRVGRFICHVHTYQTDEVCLQLAQRYRAVLGLEFAKIEQAKRRTPGPWFKYPAGDFLRKFNSDHHVIAFGNMFGVGGRELRFQGTAPLVVRPQCRGFLVPSRAIQDTAVGFIDMFLGRSFISVHLRRGDFFQHCLRGPGKSRKKPCYHPLNQIALCLKHRLALLAPSSPLSSLPHAPPSSSSSSSSSSCSPGIVFIATNAVELELEMLQAALHAHGCEVALLRLPALTSAVAAPWAEPLMQLGLGKSAEVASFLDKTICAFSAYFFGTAGSTFTHDIMRIREWWKVGAGCDTYICPAHDEADILPFSKRNTTSSDSAASSPSSSSATAGPKEHKGHNGRGAGGQQGKDRGRAKGKKEKGKGKKESGDGER